MEIEINGQLVNIDEVISKTIKSQGNSGMVIIPKKYIGQEAIICIVSEEEYGDYEIKRDGFTQTISVDWQDESIRYYHNNTGVWLQDIDQVKSGWSYQDDITQEAYEKFITDISEDDTLLTLISDLGLNESILSLNDYEIKRIA